MVACATWLALDCMSCTWLQGQVACWCAGVHARTEARALRLMQQILDMSNSAEHTQTPFPSARMVARSDVEAALPSSTRAAVCCDEVVQCCCNLGLLEVGLNGQGGVWFWLTHEGQQLCIEHFGVL